LFAGEISDRARCRDYAPAAPGVKQAKILIGRFAARPGLTDWVTNPPKSASL
jgi:hypothetical protein